MNALHPFPRNFVCGRHIHIGGKWTLIPHSNSCYIYHCSQPCDCCWTSLWVLDPEGDVLVYSCFYCVEWLVVSYGLFPGNRFHSCAECEQTWQWGYLIQWLSVTASGLCLRIYPSSHVQPSVSNYLEDIYYCMDVRLFSNPPLPHPPPPQFCTIYEELGLFHSLHLPTDS